VRALLPALGYLCGTVPFGVLWARLAGVDVRRAGSGNIGAANVARTAGMALGLATLAADVLKGALHTVVAQRVGGDALAAATGLAAVLGHVFPVTLGFKGGKGVATALGALAMLAPGAALAGLATFAIAVATFGYVSVGSLLGGVVVPLAALALGAPAPTLAAAAAMAALILVRHRDNLHRLRAGTEPRVRLRKKQAAPGK